MSGIYISVVFYVIIVMMENSDSTVGRRILQAILLCVAYCFVPQYIAAQRVHISGRVYDENGEPVELATVNESHFLTSTITNLQGHYDISLAYRDTLELVFRMVGHETRRRTLTSPSDSIVLDVMLPSSGYALEGVTISDMRRQTDANQTITMEGAHLSPDASGSGYVETIISTQAGVSSHNELSSQYNVRGGNFDENSVYVNGIEILRPLLVRAGQQEGLSFINSDMVESISFSTGGFAAMYGDKMSSVLDINYRKPTRLESTVSASLLGASAYVGFGNDRFCISNSLRYKTNRALLGTLDTQGEYRPDFLDYQLYASWTPDDKWEMSILGNIASNSYKFTPSDRNTTFGTMEDPRTFKVYFDGWESDLFRTMFGSFDLTRKIDLQNSVSLRVSTFHSNESESYDIMSQYWLDNAEDNQLAIGTFMEHARNRLNSTVTTVSLSGKHRFDANDIRWGMDLQHEAIDENMREWESRDSAGYMMPNTSAGPLNMIYSLRSSQEMESNRLSLYVQDTWRHSSRIGLLTLNGGIRASYWDWNEEMIVSPRASISLIPASNDNLVMRLSGGLYYQAPFYKELKDSTFSDGVGTVTLNRNIKSQQSIQVILGGDYHFRAFDRQFKLTVEAYYKKLNNLIPYNVDNVRIVYYGTNCAHGYAYGIDAKLFGEFIPGADSWITFSLMKTQECINGKWMPRPTDQRYNLSFYFTDFFPRSDKWRMTLRASLSDGLPTGPPHGGREQEIYKTPAYKRIDIGMSYRLLNNELRLHENGIAKAFKNIWLGIDCFNLFGNNNVNSYYWITDVDGTQFAIPNYLTGRQLNFRILMEF